MTPRFYKFLVPLVLFACISGLAWSADFQIDADIPGGNIVVEKIKGDNVYLHTDLRDTKGFWFYWHFRVRNAQGRKLVFHFRNRNSIGVRGPAVSVDAGASWSWLFPKAVNRPSSSFSFAIPDDSSDVRFCVAFPYVGDNLRAFLDRHRDSPHLKIETLCQTRKGRDVELLLLGNLDRSPSYRVALTCRSHACETMASFALEGIIGEVLSDSDDGRWLREHVAFFIVPMVDKDGVEDGDQGKNRKPHDHNRDYGGSSIYPEVQVIRDRLPTWADGELTFALDMHCPWIRGGINETVFFVGSHKEEIEKESARFRAILRENQKSGLVGPKDHFPFGQGWNKDMAPTNMRRWAATLPGVKFASTIEIPYANANNRPVTDVTARALGQDLARALRKYLETLPNASASQL